MVCLARLGELLVLVVRTVEHVFLQMHFDCLEKRCVLMIGSYLVDYLLAFLEDLGMLLVGTGVGLLISNFGEVLKNWLFTKKFYVYCTIL